MVVIPTRILQIGKLKKLADYLIITEEPLNSGEKERIWKLNWDLSVTTPWKDFEQS